MKAALLALALAVAVATVSPAVHANETGRALAAALAKPPAGEPPGLAFRRDPAITARERDAMVSRIAAQGGADSGLAKSVQSGRLLKTFEQLMVRYGYAPDDLGDVLAAYLVLAWEVVNDADSTRQPEGIRAVRRQVGAAMATLPEVRRLDDAARQVQAQRTGYMAMVAATNRQVFKSAGETARLATLQRDVRQQVLGSTGIDLEDYVLTRDGLQPR